MPSVEWSVPAFEQVEDLPLSVAFEIVRRVDLLESFPQLGVKFAQPPALAGCRQSIVERKYRVIYEFGPGIDTVWILAVQRCKQKLPRARDLDRARRRS